MRRHPWLKWLLPGAAVIILALLMADWQRARVQAQTRRHRVGTLQLACRFYAHDHGGAYPSDLRALFPRYLNSESRLAYATNEVEYFPGLTNTSNPASILLREKKFDESGQRWVGHLDDSLELMESTAANRSPARQP